MQVNRSITYPAEPVLVCRSHYLADVLIENTSSNERKREWAVVYMKD